MSDLQTHQELKKGLDQITRIAALINEGSRELQGIQEELGVATAALKLANDKTAQARATRDTIVAESERLEGQMAKKRIELDSLIASLREMELAYKLELNDVSAAHNSAVEMAAIKERNRKLMELYDSRKASAQADYEAARRDLSKIQADISKASSALAEARTKSQDLERTAEERMRSLDDWQSGLITKEARLTMIEDRLKRYAVKLNITL